MPERRIGKGGPPPSLSGSPRVSSVHSPWWDTVSSGLCSRPDLVGRTMTIEELAQMVPDYPDGRRPRPRTVARRLRSILELVERGQNGSRGHGATYRIVPPPPSTVEADDELRPDDEWLQAAVDRMTR